jgi:hypothetical protein
MLPPGGTYKRGLIAGSSRSGRSIFSGFVFGRSRRSPLNSCAFTKRDSIGSQSLPMASCSCATEPDACDTFSFSISSVLPAIARSLLVLDRPLFVAGLAGVSFALVVRSVPKAMPAKISATLNTSVMKFLLALILVAYRQIAARMISHARPRLPQLLKMVLCLCLERLKWVAALYGAVLSNPWYGEDTSPKCCCPPRQILALKQINVEMDRVIVELSRRITRIKKYHCNGLSEIVAGAPA